ncbi:MAG: amidohydrolase family protein [Gemmatimonadetes bacterium]|nr:amidohydrolase family protein [Gemmatimonadota bacterium]MBI2615141.1 amidohydrolase family protein [Gemmatimonadota bacterium]
MRAAAAAVAAVAAVATPLAAQDSGTLVIRGAKVFTLVGPPIENGTIVVRNGKIEAVGANLTVPAGAKVIEASGQQVYPGLFDAVTPLGLTEIGAVDVTNDRQELGLFNPHLLAATAVHPASEHIPVARANGITHTVAAPQARSGGIGGQGSLVHLDGWTVEEMLIQPSVGFVLSWPTLQAGGFGFGGFQAPQRSFRDIKKEYDDRVKQLDDWVEAARRYDRAIQAGDGVRRDLKLEALTKVTRRELPLLVQANSDRDIRNAIAWAEQQNVRMVILGGRQAWKVKAELAEKQIPVILGATQALPGAQDAAYDEIYAQPAALHQAGVKFALSTFNSSDSRTLPYQIGNAVPYGLPHEEAIKAITLYPAQILGVADRLGTIEPGKVANLIVTDGDPLMIQTAYKHVIINGSEVSLDNRHLELYQKYRSRPKTGR